ncbi:MAG: hypothetical protein KFH87_11540 [Bacteroidetes bacterium]|nr:hypothetical protein [Bacteroidota bacterium]
MKTLSYALMLMITMTAFPVLLSAETAHPPLSRERQDFIKTNLLAGLEHSSTEVRAQYVQLIIELKRAYPQYDFDYAIIPLMSTLKNEENCGMRILAALALYEFPHSRKGRFAIEQTARHCDSQRLARHCTTLLRKWNDREEHPAYTAQVVFPF